MTNCRITINDTMQDIVVKMCEGNPGAMRVLMDIIKNASDIDPDAIMGGIGTVLLLDSFGIYGTDIYVLWNDICNRELNKTIAVLRATQMGLFESYILKNACGRQDYSGRDMIPVDELYAKLKEKLPNFDLR